MYIVYLYTVHYTQYDAHCRLIFSVTSVKPISEYNSSNKMVDFVAYAQFLTLSRHENKIDIIKIIFEIKHYI